MSEDLVGAFERFAGDGLRDVWAFDEDDVGCLYVRDDVADAIADHDPRRYIDNERYGYITRRTYEDLTYASYEYTVRGFDAFSAFRTFLTDVEGRLYGVVASVDPETEIDFGEVNAAVAAVEGVRFAELVAGADDRSGARASADD